MTRLLGGMPGTTITELLRERMAVWNGLGLEADEHHFTGHTGLPCSEGSPHASQNCARALR